jgi:hypothetical protein
MEAVRSDISRLTASLDTFLDVVARDAPAAPKSPPRRRRTDGSNEDGGVEKEKPAPKPRKRKEKVVAAEAVGALAEGTAVGEVAKKRRRSERDAQGEDEGEREGGADAADSVAPLDVAKRSESESVILPKRRATAVAETQKPAPAHLLRNKSEDPLTCYPLCAPLTDQISIVC